MTGMHALTPPSSPLLNDGQVCEQSKHSFQPQAQSTTVLYKSDLFLKDHFTVIWICACLRVGVWG